MKPYKTHISKDSFISRLADCHELVIKAANGEVLDDSGEYIPADKEECLEVIEHVMEILVYDSIFLLAESRAKEDVSPSITGDVFKKYMELGTAYFDVFATAYEKATE